MRVVAEGRRVALRPFREEDVDAIEVWYSEAAKAAGIPHPQPLHHGGQVSRSRERGDWQRRVLVVERVGEPEPIGVVEYEVNDGWMTIGFIGVAKAYRGWGYGSEGVRLLEGEAERSWGISRVQAEVDSRNGLGLYFWLRLGYRPTDGGSDTLAMVRVLEPR